MDAVVFTRFGGPEGLQHKHLPKPAPVPGEVLAHVKAFGLNHAEMHMRRGEWDEWDPISGLECVGIVDACPGGEVALGSTVMGVMGGMGRNRPGGYAEFVNVPASKIIRVETGLSWEELAALPEVYCTAYTCLFTILDLESHFDQNPRFDKVLNLIGNTVLLETTALTRPGGRMLQAGWLGGLEPVPDFNPMLQIEPGVHFSLFHSKVLGSIFFVASQRRGFRK